jgi:RIO-like serine/threonine protein kinase
MDGVLSEEEFDRYCAQTYDRRLKVAMKFMRNQHEHAREIQMRDELHDSSCVLGLLPMAAAAEFESHIHSLTLHGGVKMAAYPHVLVMPAADRSLEDIYLKERPNDNQIRSMLQEVAGTLQALHASDVVHGDLKKLNVLRVSHHMQLIDMDAATRVGKPVGAKFSSGILPPGTMIHL